MAPLKVIKHLFGFNCNLGTEGIVDGYLCDNLADPAPANQVILAVFVARHEDYSVRLTKRCPTNEAQVSANLKDIMDSLQALYMDYSIAQRNSCALLH